MNDSDEETAKTLATCNKEKDGIILRVFHVDKKDDMIDASRVITSIFVQKDFRRDMGTEPQFFITASLSIEIRMPHGVYS